MNIVIDTGAEQQTGAIAYVTDWMKDLCPASYTEAQIVQAYAHHIIGDMRRPAKLDTVRHHITAFNWAFLRHIADEQPGLFDEFWTAYAERVDGSQ